MNHTRELLKGSTESLLLSVLSRKPLYGYQILKELAKGSGGYFQFKEGTLYPALQRLEKSGLVKGKWEKSEIGLPRRYYYITEKGLATLQRMMEEWRHFSTAVNLVVQSE